MRKVLHIIYLLSLFAHLNCSKGWSIMGYNLTDKDSLDVVFIELMDSDSTMHYYIGKVYNQQNWCYLHQQFEDIVHKDG